MNFLLPLTGSFAQPAAENPTVAMIEAAYRHQRANMGSSSSRGKSGGSGCCGSGSC